MSKLNGDKARYGRLRKKKIQQRMKRRELKASQPGKAKPAA